MLARELRKLKGRLPPLDISRGHPGWTFHDCEGDSWHVDLVLGQRLDKDIADITNRINESKDPQLRKRLAAECRVLHKKLRALCARGQQRARNVEARQNAEEEARK